MRILMRDPVNHYFGIYLVKPHSSTATAQIINQGSIVNSKCLNALNEYIDNHTPVVISDCV
jgi:hypothetical protein